MGFIFTYKTQRNLPTLQVLKVDVFLREVIKCFKSFI